MGAAQLLQKRFGRLHLERLRRQEAMPAAVPARRDTFQLERDDRLPQHSDDPADGASEAHLAAAPAQGFREGHRQNQFRQRVGKHLYGGLPRIVFAHEGILTLWRLLELHGVGLHPARTGKADQRGRRVALRVEAGVLGGSAHDALFGRLLDCYLACQRNQSARRAQRAHRAVRQAAFVQRLGKFRVQLLQRPAHKRRRQLFAPNLQ
jgi:hypothetical protein